MLTSTASSQEVPTKMKKMEPMNAFFGVFEGKICIVTSAKNRFLVRLDNPLVTASPRRWLCYLRKGLSRLGVGWGRLIGKLALPSSHDRGCETVAHEIDRGAGHIHQGVHA